MTKILQTSLRLHIIIGLIIGLISACLLQFKILPNFFLIYVQIFGVIFLLANPYKQSFTKHLISSLFCSALATTPFYYWQHLYGSTIIMLVAFLNAYAINAFHVAFYSNKKWLDYSGLYNAVWDSFIALVTASIFTIISWLFIYLCSALLSLLQINIDNIINSEWFINITTCTTFSVGLYIIIKSKKITENIREIILSICKYLLPILSFVSLIFFITWLTTLNSIHQADRSTQFVFISMSFISIIFINAVYNRESAQNPYPSLITWLIRIFMITTPIYSSLGLYFFIKNHTTLTLSNILILTNFFILIIYNLSYAIAAFLKQKYWENTIVKANIPLAFLLIFLTLITNNSFFYAHFKNQASKPYQQKLTFKNKYEVFLNTLKGEQASWINKDLSNNLVNIGSNEKSIFLCRNEKYNLIGLTDSKKIYCKYIENDKIVKTKTFSILKGDLKTAWSNDAFYKIAPKDMVFISGYTNQENLSICRSIYKNLILYGIQKRYSCQLIDQDKVINATYWQTLYLQPNN